MSAALPLPAVAELRALMAKATAKDWRAMRTFLLPGVETSDPDRVCCILINDDARLAEAMFANLDALLAEAEDAARMREVLTDLMHEYVPADDSEPDPKTRAVIERARAALAK